MIYIHSKIIDNQNNDYVFENPSRNIWGLIKDGVTLVELPTKKDLVQYRQCLFGNEAFTYFVDEFEKPVDFPHLSYTLCGYTNEKNKDKMLKIAQEILSKASILIYLDICDDKDDSDWQVLKDDFIAKYPDDYKDRIFTYSSVRDDKNIRDKIVLILENDCKVIEVNN